MPHGIMSKLIPGLGGRGIMERLQGVARGGTIGSMSAVLPLPPKGMTTEVEQDAVVSRHMVLIDQLINWSVVNPGKPWSHAAAAFQLSNLFVRTVVSTDAFRARYAELSGKILEGAGIMTLKDKINAAAEIGVERLAAKLEVAESVEQITDATEMLLGQIYGSPGKAGGAGPSVSSVTVNVQQTIRDARDKLLSGATIDVLPTPEPAVQKEGVAP